MLSSYYSAVAEAMSTCSSLSNGNIFGTFGGWELGINTETGVIFHAIMR